MKYQPQHDLIDPEVPSPETVFEYEGDDDPEAPNDAYVIGEHGNTVQGPLAGAGKDATGPKAWAKPAAFLLVTLAVALTIWNLNRVVSGPAPPPEPSSFQVKQALYLGVMKVDAYRRVHGVTPDSLTAAGLPDTAGYAYRRIDPAHYVLAFGVSGPKLEYDSSVPKEGFFGSPREMLTMGDPQ